jgi:hypothetical protein
VAQSLFTSQTPSSANNSDGTPGITTATSVMFTVAGTITAVRFYATTTVSGTYTGAVWEVTSNDGSSSGTGTLLGSKVRPSGPTAGAWNTIVLDTPVAVTTGKLYRVGLHNTAGRYVATGSFAPFVGGAGGLTNGDIWAPHTGDNPAGLGSQSNGTFEINAALAYPTDTFSAGCYFVDVVFEPAGGSVDLTSAISLPALQASGALVGRAAVSSALALPALAVSGALVGRSAVSSALSLPALQASGALAGQAAVSSVLALPALAMSGALVTGNTVASALSMPALQMSGTLSSRSALASALSLPALQLSGTLSVPVAPAEDTSSPNPPISTITRTTVIATISRERVIMTESRGGAYA